MDYDKMEKEFYESARAIKAEITISPLPDNEKEKLCSLVDEKIQEYEELKRERQKPREINRHSIEIIVVDSGEIGFDIEELLSHIIREQEANRTAMPFPYPFSAN